MVYKYMVCVDGSDVNDRAFKWAMAQAILDERRTTQLFIVHIVDKMRVGVCDKYLEQRKELGIKGMEAYTKEMESMRIPFDVEVIETTRSTNQVICEFAEKHKVDMLIVGHDIENKPILHRLLDGHHDTYEYAVKHANCPVLVFK
ncbi:hypothetical protein SAMD00019534_023570, partial [Acytostelium subglobosum LB1]|uniref:hypothetical protein n=1 Tax=Acytostelium subglobosum LB1 TaxID=1410327 RepID=UPI000644861B